MQLLDYAGFRDRLAQAFSSAGKFQVRLDEVVYLSDGSRGCEILVYPDGQKDGVWGKLGFEWVAENQAFYEEAEHAMHERNGEPPPLDREAAEVNMHAAFHLHFDEFDVTADVIRDVAETMKARAEEYFSDEGGVVAEVRLTSDAAKLECLRFEVNATGAAWADEPWWERWGAVFAGMLEHLERIHGDLQEEFGSACGDGPA